MIGRPLLRVDECISLRVSVAAVAAATALVPLGGGDGCRDCESATERCGRGRVLPGKLPGKVR